MSFKKPYLIQRLEAPRGVINPFSFGGGLINGGLSKDALKLLKDIISFDYMGSAEFERGAVPKAFKVLAKDKLVTGTVDGAKKPIWYICYLDIEPDVRQWIKDEVASQNGHTKECVCLRDALNDDKYCKTIGWLALEEYPFMCFIDKVMWENICKLFAIKIPYEL